MDVAIQAFLITVAVIGGILSPVIVVAIFGAIGNTMKALAGSLNVKAEELKKLPPFDDVEANLNPATNVLTVRFIKNGKLLYEGAASRRESDK